MTGQRPLCTVPRREPRHRRLTTGRRKHRATPGPGTIQYLEPCNVRRTAHHSSRRTRKALSRRARRIDEQLKRCSKPARRGDCHFFARIVAMSARRVSCHATRRAMMNGTDTCRSSQAWNWPAGTVVVADGRVPRSLAVLQMRCILPEANHYHLRRAARRSALNTRQSGTTRLMRALAFVLQLET